MEWKGLACLCIVWQGTEENPVGRGQVAGDFSKKNIYTENDSESGEAITRNAIHVEKSTGTKPLRQEAGNFRGRVPS